MTVYKAGYVNTLVFTVISGLVSVALLAMLVMGADTVSRFIAFVITLEVGLLVVAVTAIVRLYRHERRLEHERDADSDSKLRIASCPDYWTMEQSKLDASPVCRRTYTIPGDDDQAKIVVEGGNEPIDLSNYQNKSVAETCKLVYQQRTPWTDARAVCAGYALSPQSP